MLKVVIVLVIVALSAHPSLASARSDDDHTAREEQEGKKIWEKLGQKRVTCPELSETDFGALGEYVMGQMLGDAHPSMNEMMERMHGEEREEQMHVVMGKRLSGCDPGAAFPKEERGWIPMMGMMSGPWNISSGAWWSGWLSMTLWWVLIGLSVIALVKWLTSQHGSRTTSALDILKERYARGEIKKKEFEDKKKDLENN